MIQLDSNINLGNLIANQSGDMFLFPVNRNNFEEIDYQSRFKKEFKDTFTKKDTLYIITGTDSGLMVKQLLAMPQEKGSSYIFIEFPEIIELTRSQYDLSEQKRIVVTTQAQWEEEAKKLGMETYFLINKVVPVKSFASQYYYINEYLFLRKAIEDQVNHFNWQYQSQVGSQIFIQRQLENLAENNTPAITIKDYFRGKPALILAGGPSLDKYIEWIEQHQEHFVVIAVSRIARRLLKTKIKPDIFVSVDPHASNYKVSREIYLFEDTSLLINQYHISPRLLGNWLGTNLYLGNLFPWSSPLNGENFQGIGPTVTNTAILLAIQLGIKQQILFGVDLCYSLEGFSHASGSIEHDQGPDINLIGQTVTTNNGELAETNSAYFDAINTIEQLAELAKQSGSLLINPSPDSARIQNVEHQPIELIEISKEKISITAFLEDQKNNPDQVENKIQHFKKILSELKKAQIKLKKIKKLARQGIEYNKKLFSNNTPSSNYKFKLKMDKLEKELNSKSLLEFSNLAKKFGAHEFLYFLNPLSEKEWTDEDIKNSGETYYKALRSGAEKMSRNLLTSINRTESRLLEYDKLDINQEILSRHFLSLSDTLLLDDKPKKELIKNNAKKIMNQYISKDKLLGSTENERLDSIKFFLIIMLNSLNHQPRRIYLLEKNKPTFFYPDKSISILGKPASYYVDNHKNLSTTLLNHKTETQDINLILEGLEVKLYNLFILNDKKGIENIIKGIQLINQDNPEVMSFKHLAKGYLNELNDNSEQAIGEYGYANSDHTIESALKRIAIITLNNNQLEYAHDTLQILSNLSPLYYTQLAELYMLTRNYKDAIDAYSSYLDYNSSDIAVLMKIADLYKKQNIIDGVRFIYERILELEPDNKIILEDLKALPLH